MGQAFLLENANYHHALGASLSLAALGALVELLFQHGAIFVADDDSTLVGLLALVVAPHEFTGELTASEIVWWVEPAQRTGSVGPRLLVAAHDYAIAAGAAVLKMVAPVDSGVDTFYARLGYRLLETVWVKRLR